MSIFKEGYHTVNLIQNHSRQIFPDAADYGAPTTEGDKIWMWVKQAIEWYGVKGSRRQTNYSTGTTVTHDILLMNEGGRLPNDRFRITYTTTRGNKNHDGYFQVVKVNSTPYEQAADQ